MLSKIIFSFLSCCQCFGDFTDRIFFVYFQQWEAGEVFTGTAAATESVFTGQDDWWPEPLCQHFSWSLLTEPKLSSPPLHYTNCPPGRNHQWNPGLFQNIRDRRRRLELTPRLIGKNQQWPSYIRVVFYWEQKAWQLDPDITQEYLKNKL